jgi:hypothetical protein
VQEVADLPGDWYVSKGLFRVLSGIGGAEMKRIIVSAAIVLVIILMTLTLQSCFTPYPTAGTPEREMRDRQIWEQMERDRGRGY